LINMALSSQKRCMNCKVTKKPFKKTVDLCCQYRLYDDSEIPCSAHDIIEKTCRQTELPVCYVCIPIISGQYSIPFFLALMPDFHPYGLYYFRAGDFFRGGEKYSKQFSGGARLFKKYLILLPEFSSFTIT